MIITSPRPIKFGTESYLFITLSAKFSFEIARYFIQLVLGAATGKIAGNCQYRFLAVGFWHWSYSIAWESSKTRKKIYTTHPKCVFSPGYQFCLANLWHKRLAAKAWFPCCWCWCHLHRLRHSVCLWTFFWRLSESSGTVLKAWQMGMDITIWNWRRLCDQKIPDHAACRYHQRRY